MKNSLNIPYKVYRNSIDLAYAIFARCVKPNVETSLHGIFFGKLKVLIESGYDDTSYTYMKRDGVAVIHVSLRTACKSAGLLPGEEIASENVQTCAKMIKMALEGFVYHEIGHLYYTDMTGELLKAIAADPKWSPYLYFIKDVVNICEDPTMEKGFSSHPYYRRTKVLFKNLVKTLFIPQGKAYSDDGSIASFLNYLLLFLRIGPKAIAGSNKIFDELAAKGLYDRIRAAHRERNARARMEKQIELAKWIIEENKWPTNAMPNQQTPERPIIILVDPKDRRKHKKEKLQPQDAPLPPVSIVEASEPEDGQDDDKTPDDAIIIDMRKNKNQDDSKSDKAEGSSPTSQPEKEKDEEQDEDGETKSEKKDLPSKEETSDDKDESKESNGSSHSEDDEDAKGKSEENDDKDDSGASDQSDASKDSSNDDDGGDDESADTDEDGNDSDGSDDSDDSNVDSDQSDIQDDDSDGGDGGGADITADDSFNPEDFDWEVGGENALSDEDIQEELNLPDDDLDDALRVDAEAEGNYARDASADYEVDYPNLARDTFNACAKGLKSLPSEFAASLLEIKAETASQDLHWQSDGVEIDLDDYMDAKASNEKTLDVYRREEEGREITDLAVSLLVDCSSSMNYSKNQCAYQAVVMAMLACEEADVPLEIAAFSTGGILYVKHFEDDPSDAQEMVGLLNRQCRAYHSTKYGGVGMWGGTDLEHALPLVVDGLKKYKGRECKLIFVITDGETKNPDLTGQIIKRAKEEGIAVIGIGVGCNLLSLRKCFEKFKAFERNSLMGLPVYVAEQIEEAMLASDFKSY